MGTAKSKGLPRCTAHRDCFANKDGVCVCLGDNDFHGKDCPFFKTTAQCDADRQKSYERLVSIGRDDLIERYEAIARKRYNKYGRPADNNKKYGRAWKRIRDRYAAAHPLCELCLKEGRLTPVEEVHHIVPLSQGGTHRNDNLMSLCQSCHTKLHHELGDR